MKRTLSLILALIMMFALASCAEEAPKAEPTVAATEAPAPVETEAEAVSDGKVTYTIHVQDESGAAIAGAMVQICMDTCLPGMTDAEGNAVFTVDEADYKVSFLTLPAGYTYTTEETEFYFDGATEITLTLKAE